MELLRKMAIMIPIILLITLVSAVICYEIAKSRSANKLYWTVMGVLFGPFAIPFAMMARPMSDSSEDR